MYLSFFKLKKIPFQSSAKLDFVWPGKSVKKTLITVRKDLLDNSGISVLTGDLGTGKSTIGSILAKNLMQQFHVGLLTDPGSGELEFLNAIAHGFNLPNGFASPETFFRHFKQYLTNVESENKRALLIIDEAQKLDSSKLDLITTIVNTKVRSSRILRIILIGHESLDDKLNHSSNAALKALIAGRHSVAPLTAVESADYIRSRMKFAGAERPIFTADAIMAVHNYSGGILRQINTLCDNALFDAYIAKHQEISEELVRKAAKKFGLASEEPEHTTEHEKDQTNEPGHSTLPPKFFAAGAALGICFLGAILLYHWSSSPNIAAPVITSDDSTAQPEPAKPVTTAVLVDQDEPLVAETPSQQPNNDMPPHDVVAASDPLPQASAHTEQVTPEALPAVAQHAQPEDAGSNQQPASLERPQEPEVDYQAYTKPPEPQEEEKRQVQDEGKLQVQEQEEPDPGAIIDWLIERRSDR